MATRGLFNCGANERERYGERQREKETEKDRERQQGERWGPGEA